MKMEETPQQQDSFIAKIFNCCVTRNTLDFEIRDDESITSRDNSLLIKSKNDLENEFLLFPASIIREEEQNKIDFTKDGLLEFFSSIQNLNYQNIYEENDIKISKANSSIITDKFPLIRIQASKSKSYFTKVPSIRKVIDTFSNPEIRKKWDNNIKDYRIIEKINNNSEIVKIITNKQLPIISEKEFYNKRIEIESNRIYYLFSSSIPENTNFISLDYDKAINFLSLMIIKEDKNKFYFDLYNQNDTIDNINDNFIESNLPNRVISFFEKYFEFLNVL
jgi:hypothetical protein